MTAEWIAVDWGTTNLRVWIMGPNGVVVDHLSSDQGMGTLTPDAFEPALLGLIDGYLSPDHVTPVFCCGMVGARQGWAEAPYANVPTKPAQYDQALAVPSADSRISVHILPGLSQSHPADVMRGEETQIAGYLAQNPDFDGVLCLPGTHSKWAHISAGEVVSFKTYMTGELFALLSQGSVLRHSLGGPDWDNTEWDNDAFIAAVDHSYARPQSVAGDLFSIRARDLLVGTNAGQARAGLSGSLIGLELAAARPYWLGQQVVLIGAPAMVAIYDRALGHLGAMVARHSGDDVTLAGLCAAYQMFKDAKS